ncbi:hypothetical protein MMC21_005917 [Puttea exsequens]|nr:hypothetical protein [Puttea exsequens]
MDGNSGYASGLERGARRRKLAEYLQTANKIRHSYQQAYGIGGQKDGDVDEDESSIPGAFPDVAVVRSGDEEMLLFPSYARRHHARKPEHKDIPGASQDIRSETRSGDAEYWKKEWEKYEDDNAIVDVDIRGWVYTPHKGQMTRKNRLLIGIARQLSGIPAPSSSRASSPASSHHARIEARNARHEEELAEKEAESIARKGQGEADVAGRGGYSEAPSRDIEQPSLHSSPGQSRSPSPDLPEHHRIPRPLTNSSLESEHHDPGLRAIRKRESWTQPSNMSSAELSIANAHLMTRLKPFLTTPLVSTSLTAFFYNEQASRSRTVTTNDAGHFSLRAPLDFVPTHVRVLASDKLSATEVVRITDPKGVSVISDIDDTIKHSGIGNGAREIFRNAFIRDLGDLTIEGVKEWYSTMADMGVQFHYVSNSPWQLFPILTSYFAGAGLPRGSFHLKQYTGMLQGIFEPVAERKKGTLEKILNDFPERRFVLCGDSGEADLELYLDIVMANPGRILGVFIRDVTTSKPPRFFESAMRPRGSRSPLRGRSSDSGGTSPKRASARMNENPPALPPREISRTASTLSSRNEGPAMGRLIDFDVDEPTPGLNRSLTDTQVGESERRLSATSIRSLPPRPSKPKALRSPANEQKSSATSPAPDRLARKPAPPAPPKPRQYSTSQEHPNQPNEPSPLSQTHIVSPPGSRATSLERQSYRATVRNKVASAYNSLPSLYYSTPPTGQPPMSDPANPASRQPPPIPPRRNISSYPAVAAQYATQRLGGGRGGTGDDRNDDPDNLNGNDPTLSKKEELWLRRWARAKEILDEKGVVLKSWRVGEDVADEAIKLVEKALREQEKR